MGTKYFKSEMPKTLYFTVDVLPLLCCTCKQREEIKNARTQTQTAQRKRGRETNNNNKKKNATQSKAHRIDTLHTTSNTH